jgi:ABC-type transport system involved in multi-copper enzyme maturation permease subunit
VFGYGLMVGLILLAPVFPATSIVREKQQGTLALLLNSPMSPWAILTGKLLGVLGYIVLLILLSLPAAAACFTMGGVDRGQLVGAYTILFLLAVEYATLGLFISSFANTSDSALRATYGAVLLLSVVTLGPHQFLQGLLQDPISSSVIDWVRCVSPIPAMMECLNQSGVASQGLVERGAMMKFDILALIFIAVFLVLTARRFNQRMFDRPRATGTVTDEQSSGVRRFRRLMFVIDPNRRSNLIGPRPVAMALCLGGAAVLGALAFFVYRLDAKVLELPVSLIGAVTLGILAVALIGTLLVLAVSINPVTTKELRSRRFGRPNWLFRLGGFCLILSLGLMLATTRGTESWGVETLGAIMVLLSFALILLLTPTLAAGLISGERESGGWVLLQSTPLSALSVVLGKLMSVGTTLVLILIATLPGYAVIVLIDKETQLVRVPLVLLSLLLTALFALLLSAATSSLFRRTAPATATAYTILVGLCAGTMLFWLGRDSPFTFSTVESVLKFNPLAASLKLIDAPGFKGYQLLPANWWIMAAGCGVCLVVLIVQTWRLSRPQ